MAKKIKKEKLSEKTIVEIYADYLTAQTARDLSESTIRNYKTHFKAISKHLDTEMTFSRLTKRDLEEMVVSMKESDLAHNSISTYVRAVNQFLKWCVEEGLCSSSLILENIKEQETVKGEYTDEELLLLIRKPSGDCDFCEYRNWVIVNFLLNSGCRAASIRNIQNRDVDLKRRQIVLRHNKNKKIQVLPLCTQMVSILDDYMKIRKGDSEEYLFCNQFGDKLSGSALRQAIAKYNRKRGVYKTSTHLYRHTFSRKYLVDCGGNAFTLQKLLGHSTLTMTKRYCRLYDKDLAENFDSLSPLAQIKASERRKIIKK
ncbi:MAG: tyrosine-type recombinase/integrase [Anaerovoracaceae bacterium]